MLICEAVTVLNEKALMFNNITKIPVIAIALARVVHRSIS
jgi:hypothetical protein